MLTRDGDLFIGHVHADDGSVRPDELRYDVAVATRPRAKVEHRETGELVRDAQAAPVVFGDDLWVHVGESGADLGRRGGAGAARVGREVVRCAQRLPVVLAHLVALLVVDRH